MQQRSEAAALAMSDVDEAVDAFMRWLYGIRAGRTLKRIRQHSHDFERELTDRALRKTLTNKILHLPSKRLREAAELRDYEVLKAADRIFRSEDEQEEE